MLFAAVLSVIVGLGLTAEVCYPPCGCHSNDAPFNDRPLPESDTEQQLTYSLYTPSNPTTGVTIHWDSIPPQWSSSRKTLFVIHGFNNGPGAFNRIRQALFDTNHDVNVITVDWSTGASRLDYTLSASNTRVVGACTAHLAQLFVDRGQSWFDVHCVGASLGGQACGYMGKHTNGSLGRITGLDPAGPWFFGGDVRVRLDSSDTYFMDNIHTHAGIQGLGQAVGHVDFFANNGLEQPPCDSGGCDHNICMNYFEASIREGSSCQFQSRPCATNADADAGRCEECGSGCGRMGYYAEEASGRGRHFLRTTSSYPYCEN